jgi:ADP-ribose pyrophosphatase YjhB (NUDIX family)
MGIVAAGGVVLGTGELGGQIALVRRHRYSGEVGLPKGKSRGAETPLDTALREVREETGYPVAIQEFAGTTHYFVRGVPKIVFYFVMRTTSGDSTGVEDTGEIASVIGWRPTLQSVLCPIPRIGHWSLPSLGSIHGAESSFGCNVTRRHTPPFQIARAGSS